MSMKHARLPLCYDPKMHKKSNDNPLELLKSAQSAQMNGDIKMATKIYEQYYSCRPLLTKCIPKINRRSNAPRLSIIVPCHNSGRYLEECIASILDQEFADFELILINDGSSDNSLDIICRKAEIDRRIIVINNSIPSGSAGLPRNQGINIARGELIGFVDSDDWIERTYFQVLVDAIDQNEADVAISKGFINHEENNSKERIYPSNWEIKSSEPNLSCTHLSSMIWDKVYKTNHQRSHSIGILSGSVDVPFISKYISIAIKQSLQILKHIIIVEKEKDQ